MEKSKYKIIVLLLVFSLVLVTIGTSLALFKYKSTGETLNEITVGSITFKYTETTKKGNGISITNASPVASNDDEKENNNYFEFNISSTNNTETEIPYTVTARLSDDSDIVMSDIVAIYLTDDSNNPTELFSGDIVTYDMLYDYNDNPREKIIYTDTIKTSSYNKDFRLRIWIDENANLSGTVETKYYCGEEDVTEDVEFNPYYKCDNGNSPSTSNTMKSSYNNKKFSVTVNVYAVGSEPSLNAKDTILAGRTINRTLTLNKTSQETNENGLYEVDVNGYGYGGSTTGGKTYVFRGIVDDNVVEFAGMLWRIIRINEDGSVRIILDDMLASYGFTDASNGIMRMYYSESIKNEGWARYKLLNWYQENIDKEIPGTAGKKYSDYIAQGNYFCETARVAMNISHVNGSGVPSMQVQDEYTSDLTCESYYCDNTQVTKAGYDNCEGDKEITLLDSHGKGLLSDPIGLITYEEANYAGGYTGNNTTYYLYKGNYELYTMSPAGGSSSYPQVWSIQGNHIASNYARNTKRLRPVVNLSNETRLKKDKETGYYKVQY